MDIMSDGGLFPLPSTVKQKACKPALRPVLFRHAKGEPLELPTQVVNLKQYTIPGEQKEQKEITTLICDMLEAGVLVPSHSLCSSPM